jgi:hypothetical protein
MTAISDGFHRAQALTSLAPHLPPELLTQALSLASAITDGSVRAHVLIGLVPHLPPDLQAQTVSNALDAVITITDDSRRSSGLSDLAPYLTPDLLRQALTVTPTISMNTRIAILERAKQVLSLTADRTLLTLTRSSMRQTTRSSCLGIIAIMTPELSEIGGPGAVQDCLKAMIDVHLWWP